MEEAGTQESLCWRPITGLVQLVYEEENEPRLARREKEENWEDLFDDVPDDFVENINSYAKDNLIKLRVFISTPFATEYTRSIETTRTSFIANIGGECLP